MAIHYPPKYRYALFKPWDKQAFKFISQIAKTKRYPKILGTQEDKNQSLITLVRIQKSLHDWRQFLVDVLGQIKNYQTIDTQPLNQKYPPQVIDKGDQPWVTYEEDKIVSNFMDELEHKQIDFQGTDKDIAEFVMRFILGQLSHDWEWIIMMIWEMLGDNDKISVKQLNQEMKNFDYLKLFTN